MLRGGDLVLLRSPRRPSGHEQRGRRYGIIVQSDDLAWLSTVLVVPTSTSASAAIFRPEVTIRGRKTRALADQLAAVDRGRLGRSAGRLDVAEQREVDEAVRDVLAIH